MAATESFYPYLLYEDLAALQAARDAAVVDRLLDPAQEAITRDLHLALDEACFYQLVSSPEGDKIIENIGGKRPTDISRTVRNLETMEELANRKGATTHLEAMVWGINNSISGESHTRLLDAIVRLGLIAAQHKPATDRLDTVWKELEELGEKNDPGPITEDNVFRGAVNVLETVYEQAFRDWGEVLSKTKGEARAMGSRQFNHGGLDFHRRIVDFLRTKFAAQFGYTPDLSRAKDQVTWLPSMRTVEEAEKAAASASPSSVAKTPAPPN